MITTTNESAAAPTRSGLIAWLIFAFLAVFLLTAISVGWAVRHALSDGPLLSPAVKTAAILVSNFPALLRESVREIRQVFDDTPTALLMSRTTTEKPEWHRSFPAPDDTGYLLFSGVDPQAHHSLVKLLRISDGKEMARWDPDWPAIYSNISEKRMVPKGSARNAIAVHPLLMPSGDIVFNTTNALVRLNACSRTPAWLIDVRMHHSNELAADGTIWTPSETSEMYAENAWIKERVRDESLARISPDGKILENLSFTKIMEENGIGALVLGTTGWRTQPDPLHINEIKAATFDGRYWKVGDLLVSSRHLSTVFLYRPSTRKILWYQTGPWLNQHSPNFVDDHRISIFDNHVYAGAPKEYAFLKKSDINRVFVYDFATGEASEPFKELLAAARPMTVTDGRARVLPDGGLFIEESKLGRQLRFANGKLMWSRVNDYDDERIGQLFWSRYLTADEAAGPLKALAHRQCPGQ